MSDNFLGPNLLLVADAVAREKKLQLEDVLLTIEEATAKACRAKYGHEYDIMAKIDRQKGNVSLFKRMLVVSEEHEEADYHREIYLKDARKQQPDLNVGEYLMSPLPPLGYLGRIAAQIARQVITQKIRGFERQKQFDIYKDKLGELVMGFIKRKEYKDFIVSLNTDEAMLSFSETIPREFFTRGDRVKAVLYEISDREKGYQLFLSRSRKEFVELLFQVEVPEIEQGVISIVNIAREAGSRTKILVKSEDKTIDPVGACVGIRGSRIQSVVGELNGEKIDIIPFSEDKVNVVIEALKPAEVVKIIYDEQNSSMDVVVPDDSLSIAIGRRGQNVRLASELSGISINILSEEQASEIDDQDGEKIIDLLVKDLDIDNIIAKLLLIEGFKTVGMIAGAEKDELLKIEGFDESIVDELHARAKEFLQKQNETITTELLEKGINSDLLDFFAQYDKSILLKIVNNDIKTLKDFAYLATADLVGEKGAMLSTDEISIKDGESLIIDARKEVGLI